MGTRQIMVPKRITIHCSDTLNGVQYAAEKIRAFHMAPPPAGRGWDDIGYHMVIQPDGQVELGRPLNVVGAHVEGENVGNVGICLIGGKTADDKDASEFTVRQLDALRYQLDSLKMVYQIPNWEIYCHNQWPSAIKQGKSCPGFKVNQLLAWYIAGDQVALAGVLK